MNNVLFLGLEYEDYLKSSASLKYREFLSKMNDFKINDFNYDNISKDMDVFRELYFRELISEQIGFANCFLSDSKSKTITIDSLMENKKDVKILDILESKRKYNKFLKEKL